MNLSKLKKNIWEFESKEYFGCAKMDDFYEEFFETQTSMFFGGCQRLGYKYEISFDPNPRTSSKLLSVSTANCSTIGVSISLMSELLLTSIL